jgi:DNA-binding CsgD family transcriptional regulator
MTSRERDIADLISRGWSNKEIARVLDLSEGTVKTTLHRIYEKLQVNGRTELARALWMATGCAPMPNSSNEEQHVAGNDLNSPSRKSA